MRILQTFAASLLLLLAATTPARADDVSDADRATARALANEGQDALESRDFATAADRFARADALIHAPSLLLGLARAQVGLGKLVSAQETYQRLLREGLPPSPPPAFVRAHESAKAELHALEPRIPHLTIRVESAPDLVVTLDGVPVPSAAIGVKRPVDPGRHLLRASAGRAFAEATLEANEGESYELPLVLAVRTGESTPPGEARGPRREVATAPPSSGAPGSPLKTAGIATLVLGGAGLSLGIGAGIAAAAQRGSLGDKCPDGICPKAEQASVDRFHLFGTLSTVGFAAGGAATATGVILLAVAPKSKPTRDAALVPFVGPGFLGLKGTFR